MGKHNETGKIGEELARTYLLKNGYKILDINWVFNHKEIDIVAQHDNKIIFVEVKTRSNTVFELPKEAVTIKKQKNLVYAADGYLQQKEIELESRFDIISVLAQGQPKIMEHIKGAFQAHELF